MGEQNDGFDGMEGSLWRNVMSVECGNECLRVEHNLFCTNQPSVIKVYVPDQGFPDRGYVVHELSRREQEFQHMQRGTDPIRSEIDHKFICIVPWLV